MQAILTGKAWELHKAYVAENHNCHDIGAGACLIKDTKLTSKEISDMIHQVIITVGIINEGGMVVMINDIKALIIRHDNMYESGTPEDWEDLGQAKLAQWLREYQS